MNDSLCDVPDCGKPAYSAWWYGWTGTRLADQKDMLHDFDCAEGKQLCLEHTARFVAYGDEGEDGPEAAELMEEWEPDGEQT